MADYLITMDTGEKYLMHHGVKGQKWGVWNEETRARYLQESKLDRHKINKMLDKSKSSNLEKWGKTAETNTLYITGYSGSGKSTLALGLAKPGDKIIHLDCFTEEMDEKGKALRDPDFVRHLNKTFPEWNKVTVNNMSSRDYWDNVEKFDKAIESFSKDNYKKGNRVIVEGVQIADKWLKGKATDYVGKPMITLQTNAVKSTSRAFNRDRRGNLVKGLVGLDDPVDYLKWVYRTKSNLKELNRENSMRRNKTLQL